MKQFIVFWALGVCLTSCIAKASASLDETPPEIEFWINNLESRQRSNTSDLYLSAAAGDRIELSVKSLEYTSYPKNTVSLTIFNEEKVFHNQETSILTVIVPDGISGVFPATATYERIYQSTTSDVHIGLYSNTDKTLYIEVFKSNE